MSKRTKGLIVAAALSGAAATVYSALCYIFIDLAFKGKPRLGKHSHKELTGLAKEGQEWLHEHDNEVRFMTNKEGMKLCCHYIPCENARRTVIEFHGWHGGWDHDFSASSPFLHQMGCNLLLVEERGQGNSEGTYMTFGLKEREDLMEWISWYQENYDSEIPIYLAGVSMGAATVMMAAGEEFPPQVKGILEDCGFTSAYEIIRMVGQKRYHLPEHPLNDTINRYAKKMFGTDLKSYTAIDAVKKAKVPMLFIHGTEDTFVPCDMTKQAYEACTAPKEILLVEGAGHGMSFVVDRERYTEKISWLFSHDHETQNKV